MPAKDCSKDEIGCPSKDSAQCPGDKGNCIVYQIYYQLEEKVGDALIRLANTVRSLKYSK